ncbi:beta-lactamase family protein [Bombilactobacillus folatiphilus]|uniref:Beta-lactamase family protein n=1 Tax=Bombilactobacillus folatiphilus TaxID=2923362 RepID=A0ABY4P6U0_9LACO|nr:serine hydrolase domain-containing protein [Bombilactobacillus folatiphilus]UQS81463.1 beta-lactamase family protein [Bombilactobacillus folatiphilus]
MTPAEQKINQLMKTAINQKIVYGVSYAFVSAKEEQIFYLGDQGKNQEKVALEPDMLYDLASLTKVVATTTRILQLLEQNQIHLDDHVGYYLPMIHYPQITIKQLLLHNSGLPADISNPQKLDSQQLINAITHAKLLTPSNTNTIYSDLGYILLGWLIEQIDGNLAHSFAKNIFEPLNMQHTKFNPISNQTLNFVPTEFDSTRGGLIRGHVHDEKAAILGGISGHAGLFSTLNDLTKFTRMYLNQGCYHGQQLLNTTSFAYLKKTYCRGRTLGWKKWTPTGNQLWHTGFTGTSIALDLDHQTGFICLTNRIYPTRNDRRWLPIRREAIKLFYHKEEKIIND